MSFEATFIGGPLDGETRHLMWVDDTGDLPAEMGAFAVALMERGDDAPGLQVRARTILCQPGEEDGWPAAARYELNEWSQEAKTASYKVRR